MPIGTVKLVYGGIEDFMKFLNHGFNSGEEGKGSIGCIFAIILMVIAIVLAVKLGPLYYNHYEFKGELKQLVSRAGARLNTNENIKRDVVTLAQKNRIFLKDDEIIIDKSVPTRVIIEIKYIVPVDFIILKRDLNFHIREEGVSFM